MKQKLFIVLFALIILCLIPLYYYDVLYFEIVLFDLLIPISLIVFATLSLFNHVPLSAGFFLWALPALSYAFLSSNIQIEPSKTFLSLGFGLVVCVLLWQLFSRLFNSKTSQVMALTLTGYVYSFYRSEIIQDRFELSSHNIFYIFCALLFVVLIRLILDAKSIQLSVLVLSVFGLTFLLVNESFVPEINADSWEKYAHKTGDDSCVSCHSNIVEEYKLSEMGRSMFDMDSLHLALDIQNAYVYDAENDLHYRIIRDRKNYVMTETRFAEDGKTISHKLSFPIDYIVGSGANTKSFLMNHNGYIFEMPITWYSVKKKWDLSPGYTNFNHRFYREASQRCMDCHTQTTEFVASSMNRYNSVHMGIDCEQCHGPASLHIAQESGEADKTFVAINNPARQADINLVCYNCHEKNNLNPLDVVATVEFTAHATRLAYSQCFIEGDLNCMTCHDPHLPLAQTRDRIEASCFTCHTSDDIVSIKNHTVESDCISCHMPKIGASDIPHVSSTDHYIRVHRENESDLLDILKTKYSSYFEPKSTSTWEKARAISLVDDYRKLINASNQPREYIYKAQRLFKKQLFLNSTEKFYFALTYYYQNNFTEAIPILNELRTTETYKSDPEIPYFIGKSYSNMKQFEAAVNLHQAALKLYSDYFPSLLDLSYSYMELGKIDEALETVERILTQQAFHEEALYQRSYLLTFYKPEQTDEIAKSYKTLFTYFPDHHDGILNAAHFYLQTNALASARNILQRGAKKYSKSAAMLGNLARVYILENKRDSAVKLIQKIDALNPNNPYTPSLKAMLSGNAITPN
jgi:hypothetical protein